MKPIEDKMKPQIEKLLAKNTQSNGNSSGSKGNLRVRLDNMDVDGEEEKDEEDEEEDEKQTKEVKKYVAPRIRAVRYEGERFSI